MKERPILMSAPMIRAILEGRKSQTRRVVKGHIAKRPEFGFTAFTPPGHISMRGYTEADEYGEWFTKLPYGQPGDRLWVRSEHYRYGHWEPVPGVRTKGGRQKWRFVADTAAVLFDAPAEYRKGRHHHDPATPAWHKRLARFMPRAFSRITLEIVSVRIERLQDISEEDAKAEGPARPACRYAGRCNSSRCPAHDHPTMWRESFAGLWDSINGDGAWALNPFVWVVEFKLIAMAKGVRCEH